ncbi:hypothetical protein BJY04DRAFT_31365 [Aspergillus karnatakaensis]|uniref:uncharacterized protein n=1 Tax=Aspergillus karnatakaensis TaxID=1810916 RepID=UPI003CCD9CC6
MSSPSGSTVSDSVLSESSRSSGSSDHCPSPELPYRPAPPPAEKQQAFLFIDCQADTPENQELKKQKQAFLLKNYNRRRRQAAIDRLKPSESSRGRSRVAESDQAVAKRRTSTKDEDDECAKNSADLDEISGIGMMSLMPEVSQGYTDPFSSCGVAVSDSINLYLNHFRTHTMPACYPLDSARMSNWWWQKGTTQPALLRALLFLAAGHQATMETTHGLSSRVVQKSMRDCLYLRGETLKVLNSVMQDPQRALAESTALAVASLVTIEAANANFTALNAHISGLRRLISLAGGMNNLDHTWLSKLYQCDVKSAALMNTRPAFPIISQWRDEIVQQAKIFEPNGHEIETPESLEALGAAIFSAPWYPELEPSMQTLLLVFSRLIIYYESVVLSPHLVTPNDNDLFILFEHKLLSTTYTSTPNAEISASPSTSPSDPFSRSASPSDTMSSSLSNPPQTHHTLNEPLRLTLLIYLNMRIWHLQPFGFMQFMTERLRQSLIAPVPLFTTLLGTSPDLLFWVLFIGGLASQGYKSHAWFVNHLIEVTQILGVKEWDEARWILAGFFYTDQEKEKKAEEALWNEIVVREDRSIAPKPHIRGQAVANI